MTYAVKIHCHDCKVQEGQLHVPGCDMERCPFCGGQLIGCDCVYDKLGFDFQSLEESMSYPGGMGHPTARLPEDIYMNGLTPELQKEWEQILNRRGRIPYISWPNLCAYCGESYPEMFKVSNEEWRKYIEPEKRDRLVCEACWNHIVAVTDANSSSGD